MPHAIYLNDDYTDGYTSYPWTIVSRETNRIVERNTTYEDAEAWIRKQAKANVDYYILFQVARVDWR